MIGEGRKAHIFLVILVYRESKGIRVRGRRGPGPDTSLLPLS